MASKKQKAIVNSVAAVTSGGAGGGGVTSGSPSSVARVSAQRALNNKESYENNSIVRRSINVIADTESKATIRLFSRHSTQEIVSGPAFNLFKRPNKYQSITAFLNEMAKWWYITGEIAILPILNASGDPIALKLLDPTYLQAYPPQVRSLDYVTHWTYSDGLGVDGKTPIMEIPANQLLFMKTFNPYSPVRGMALGSCLVNEITSNFYVQNYNSTRFKNGVAGDIVLKFPKGTRKEVMKDTVERFVENHSIVGGNGFKVVAVASEDFKIEQLSPGGKDGEYLELSKYTDERIAAPYGVPPILMGNLDKSRFDTADVELEAFAENRVHPDLLIYAEILQQIIDRFFPGTSGTKKVDVKNLSRSTKRILDKAVVENQVSDMVVILDVDSIPIFARINLSKLQQAKEIREALLLTPNEAAAYMGIDIAPNPLRDDIWVPNNVVNVSNHSANPRLQPTPTVTVGPVKKSIEVDTKSLEVVDPESKQDPSDLKDRVDAVKKVYRSMRGMALNEISGESEIDKKALLESLKDLGEEVIDAFHLDFLEVKGLLRSKVSAAEIKSFFNAITKTSAIKNKLGNRN